MNRRLVWGAILMVLVLVAGCAMPTSTTSSKNENPGVLVVGAPPGAVVYVDGLEMGLAEQYAEKQALEVLPGRHVVEIRSDSSVIHREEIFSGTGSIRTIEVP